MLATAAASSAGKYEKMQQEDVPLYPNIYPPPKCDASMEIPTTAPSQPAAPLTQAMAPLLLGPSNTVTCCPFCLASIKTSVKYTATTRTHIVSGLWCIICCLCCVGCCSNSSKNSDHYCPNCKKYLGTYEK